MDVCVQRRKNFQNYIVIFKLCYNCMILKHSALTLWEEIGRYYTPQKAKGAS